MKTTTVIAVIFTAMFFALAATDIARTLKTPPPSSQAQAGKTSPRAFTEEISDAKTPKSRFFLFSATPTAQMDDGEHAPVSVVLRLDQQTGETSLLTILVTSSNAVYRFIPIK